MPDRLRTSVAIAKLGAYLGVDRAILYALLSRGWRALAGAVSIVLLARLLTEETQGYYYTFQSLLALQVFVELGLSVVVVNLASHEWARLSLDSAGRIVGDPSALSRLVSVAHKLARWYAGATLLFVIMAGAGGAWFLGQQGRVETWLLPWIVTVPLQGLALWLVPFVALIEGCNQVVAVQRLQLWQGIVGNFALWIALSMGLGLWSIPILIATQTAATLFFICAEYRSFVRPFLQKPRGALIDWRGEVWPMQWKLAVQGVVNYFVYSLYVPILFHYHGAAAAGRFGMTWQIFVVLQTLALSWVQTRVPRFGSLVATGALAEFNDIWARMTFRTLTVFGVTMTAFLLGDIVLEAYGFAISERLLDPASIALLLPVGLLACWVQCAAFYWRAFKTEPLGFAGAIPGVINGALVWWLGSRYGANGAILAYLSILTFLSLPLSIYLRHRVRYAHAA